MACIIRQQILLLIEPSHWLLHFSFLPPILLYSSLFLSLSPPFIFLFSVVLSLLVCLLLLSVISFFLTFWDFTYLFILCIQVWASMCVCVPCACRTQQRPQKSQIFWTRFAGYCDLLCGFWLVTMSHLQHQMTILLATEPSFHLSRTSTFFFLLPGQFC